METAAEQGVGTTEPPVAVETEKPVVTLPNHDGNALAGDSETAANNISRGSHGRDIALSKLEEDKKLSFIKAWEETERAKVENKAQKKVAEVNSWENTHRAYIEHQLKKYEEQLEKKKAEYAEKMKNKMALIHKQAEEKRAMVEAQRGEAMLRTEEMAAKYNATGHIPKNGFACFGG